MVDLRELVGKHTTALFYKAAVEAAFHQDGQARVDLERFISSHPAPDMLLQAQELAIGMDFRSARYRDALLAAQGILSSKPDAKDIANFLPTLEVLAPYDRQSVSTDTGSVIPIQMVDQNLILPVTVNGKIEHFILDNGFSLSGMSESEADQLKLSVREIRTEIDTMSGAQVKVRIAVVPEMIIGHTRFQNVAFYVLPDNQPPFHQLAPGRRGILGLPVVLALGHFAWKPASQTLRIFPADAQRRASRANLAFDGTSIFTQLIFRRTPLDVSLDTGAQNTILCPSFAKQYPDIRSRSTTEDHRVTGAGGSTSINSLSVPALEFEIGKHSVTLSPATVLLRENNSTTSWFHGNLGMDLLNQGRSVEMAFGAMTLKVN